MEAKFSLRHIRLNNGGYDSYGEYFGTGERLYEYASESVNQFGREIQGYVRAYSREYAKILVLAKYPKAEFFR